jgi:hypothetical protein
MTTETDNSGDRSERVYRAEVFACLIPGEIRIVLLPGRWHGETRDLPVSIVPFELRLPNTPLWVEVDDNGNIVRVWRRPKVELPRFRRALEVVEHQLGEGTPPETRATLDRLRREGFSHQQALELMAGVVLSEILEAEERGQPYEEARYLVGLRALPRSTRKRQA